MADGAKSDSPCVQAQLDRLTMLSPGRDVLGLERISALMARLGNPHRKLPPVFHVAGTNGKGSTCAFLRALLEASGRKVHVYTSPHLVRFNERIRVAGALIEDELLAPLLAEVLDCSEDIAPSFFEATTAAAFLAFARTPADAAVIEVGLGGRLDGTNFIEPPVACGIAQIGIDHEAFLLDPSNGPNWPSLERIAWEKAGIAKRGVPLVCLSQPPEAEARIAEVATATGAPLWLEGRDWHADRSLSVSLAGAHQIRNANLALAMLDRAGIALPRNDIERGLASATWPGRLQLLSDGPLTQGREVWVDGAHNTAAAEVLARELRGHPKHLIAGILANKNATGVVGALRSHALSLTFVDVPGHPSHDPDDLAAQFVGRAAPSVVEALRRLPLGEPALVIGSLYLAGEALRLNDEMPK